LKYSGLTQRQIAQQLNVKSGSTISKQIVRSRKLVAQQDELRCQVEKCEKVLREMRSTEQLLND
jgi:IS30 family transposase